ncbi:MAG: hypothetical protein ABF293_08290 [Flavobacteriaceae bacterium]
MIFGYRPSTPKRFVLILPLIGMGVFVFLYLVAAFMYPGGSWKFPEAEGFSFWNNYLCDLLDHYAINGELNNGRYPARIALGFLVSALLLLWYYLPGFLPKKGFNQKVMWISGILSLGTTFFLSTGTHDITVRVAGSLGTLAFLSLFVELFRVGLARLFITGILCLIIFLINYYIYETGRHIEALPIIQKITFAAFISWFAVLNLAMISKIKTGPEEQTENL